MITSLGKRCLFGLLCVSFVFFMCPSFSFGVEGRMWDGIVLILDHCLSVYFSCFFFFFFFFFVFFLFFCLFFFVLFFFTFLHFDKLLVMSNALQ